MAIAVDATSESFGSATTTLTWSHTCTGADRILIVGIDTGASGGDVITGITYNGIAMTQIQKRQNQFSGAPWAYIYLLKNPASGANNIVASASVAADLTSCAVSYTGTDQTTQPDVSNFADDNTTSKTISLTTTVNNCWFVAFVSARTNPTLTAGAGTVLRITNTTQSGRAIFDSGGALTPAGSHSLVINASVNMSGALVFLAFAPATVTATGRMFLVF